MLINAVNDKKNKNQNKKNRNPNMSLELQLQVVDPIEVRFDWYRATLNGADPEVLTKLFTSLGPDISVTSQKPHFRGFEHGISIRHHAFEIGHIAWGGKNAPCVLFEVHGIQTMGVVAAFRRAYPKHRLTRIDVSLDFDFDGAFVTLLDEILAIKAEYKLWGERRGDWEDHPELGRTYALGKRIRPGVMARLYEKGLKDFPEAGKTNWVRLEFEIYPDDHRAHQFATLSPLQCVASRRWAAELGRRVQKHEIVSLPVVSKVKRTTEQRFGAVCQTHHRLLASMLDSYGSWEQVGLQAGKYVRAANENVFHPIPKGGENLVTNQWLA